ncbi:M16 family metallopeptidase [Chitinimonas arctica]|nr:insulinase family protein [Chitinimonas arctica]
MRESIDASLTTSDPDQLAARALDQYFGGSWPRGDIRHYSTPAELKQDIARLDLASMQRFYTDFYGVGEGELILVGDFDVEQTRTALNRLFGDWRTPAPYRFAAEPYTELAPRYFRIQTADRANATYLARTNLPVGLLHPDRLAIQAAVRLLGDGDKSRLFQRIRTQEGLSYGISSGARFGRQDAWGSWRVSASYAPQNRERVESLIREEIDRARREGFRQDELDDLKAGWLQQLQASLAGESRQIDLLQNLVRHDEPLSRAEQEIANLQKLTLADVNLALRTYLDPARLSIAVAGNFDGKKPAE